MYTRISNSIDLVKIAVEHTETIRDGQIQIIRKGISWVSESSGDRGETAEGVGSVTP